MALLKFRAVVVLPLPFKWSSGPSKGEGGGYRSNTATYRFKDERSSPSNNICLNVLKMRVAVGAAQDERGSSSKGESSSPLKGESSSPR